MKRAKNLWEKITSFENLLTAAENAQRGKRFQTPVGKFNIELEKELLRIRKELREKTWKSGGYKGFYIYEPKPRLISAAPYRDRVVHHALCQVVTPILENSMIADTYANRSGKGTHKAVLRYQEFTRKYPYVLKCDIQKFFPSIDHEILKNTLRRKIGCQDTLWLIDTIIDGSNPQEKVVEYFPGDNLFTPSERRHGLPIGNLTSQWFGNYYLSPLDHFVKEELRCPGYVRYVDDFVLLSEDKEQLHDWKHRIDIFLENYRMKLHKNKTKVDAVTEGIGFLGHRVFPTHRLLKPENVRRFRKKMKKMVRELHLEKLNLKELEQRVQGWAVHASFSSTYYLQNQIFSQFCECGIDLPNASRVARRLLEQQYKQLPGRQPQQEQPRQPQQQ